MQVLLVTGGNDFDFDSLAAVPLVSTEVLLPSATSWIYSADLPSPPRLWLRGATLNNKVLMTGTIIDTMKKSWLCSRITIH